MQQSADSRSRLAAVVLAAGGSARFGSPKQLLTQHGENLVRRTSRIALESNLEPVIVVLGAYADTVVTFLSGLEPLDVVVNERWTEGQASSIRKGIEAAMQRNCDGALILLADQPLIDGSSLERLVDAFTNPGSVVASKYNDAIGAPALFGRDHFGVLLSLEGDHGAGKWLRDHPDVVTTVEMSEAACDIDTPEDLRHLPAT